MKERRTSPPKWMDKIIEWYCSKALLEDLHGDLHEYYARNIQKGRWRADLIFFLDVIKFCRPYTIRKLKTKGRMTIFYLIGNYFKTSVRSIARNKLFSSINVMGLAVAISIGLLMITYLSELSTFDDFHKKKDRIYHITSTYRDIAGKQTDFASSSMFIGKKLREEFSGIEKTLIVRRNFRADLTKGENTIHVRGLYSSPEFFDLFSFEWVEGNPSTALQDPNCIILTERVSKKNFGDESPIGKVLVSGNDSYKVTGLMKDLPSNSHMNFEALASMKTFLNRYKDAQGYNPYAWGNIWMNHVYFLTKEGLSLTEIRSFLKQIANEENAKTDRYSIENNLESLSEMVPGSDLSNKLGPNITWKDIYQLGVLTLIIILSASFNYTNLSIARSLRRAKEVGIRKVVGATKPQVFYQFVLEAICISILALVVAFGVYQLIKPGFLYAVIDGENVTMDFRWINILYFVAFSILIGVFSGILPSIILSRMKAIAIMSDVTKVGILKGLTLRKVLIIFQFAISMSLIIGTYIVHKQYNFSVNYDLGFRKENVLNLPTYGSYTENLRTELAKFPEVLKTSKSGMIPSTNEIWGEDFKYNNPLDSVSVYVNFVDKNYTDVHEMEFLAGSTFPNNLTGEEEGRYVIIDRRLSERFGFESPVDAVGETITRILYNGELKVRICGVIENYQYVNITEDPEPTALLQGGDDDIQYINLLVSSSNVLGLMTKIEDVWSSMEKVRPFNPEFMDEQIRQSYAHYETMYKIFGFLSFVAISISIMGLLGMAVFTTETRIKEISIRKVLGASEKNVVLVLSKSFIYMSLISALIAIPSTYLVFSSLVLEEFTERISIGFMELAPGALLIIAIGFLTIGWQTLKTAKTNPSDMLRDE